jgi:hypothetical protein
MRLAAAQIPSRQGASDAAGAFVDGSEQQLQPMDGDDWLGQLVIVEPDRLGGKERGTIGDPPAHPFRRACPVAPGEQCRSPPVWRTIDRAFGQGPARRLTITDNGSIKATEDGFLPGKNWQTLKGRPQLRRLAISLNFPNMSSLFCLTIPAHTGRDPSQPWARPELVLGPANGRTRGPMWI